MLSVKEARRLILYSQKLIGPKPSPLETLEHLGYVQIDTIAVVERAHHHVFWSRNNAYTPKDLNDLIDSRKAFEYWSHAAAYLPMKDYRQSLELKKYFKNKISSWHPRDPKMMKKVFKRIEFEGPLKSKDFEKRTSKNTGWWDWKPAKKALERLFLEGSLEITRRENFQKVYDLKERVIPKSVDSKPPTKKEFAQYLIDRTLRHHGLAAPGEMAYLRSKEIKQLVQTELQRRLKSDLIKTIEIKGLPDEYFIKTDLLEKPWNEIPNFSQKTNILSPFDNLIIQRKKLKNFFNFDYQIECYVPEKKRKYGYFTLPILCGDQFLGRIDCKADRKNKVLFVKSIHPEKGINLEQLKSKLARPLKKFAKFNSCDSFEFTELEHRSTSVRPR